MERVERGSLELEPAAFERLDALMEAAALDVLLVSSAHNRRYLLGGYEPFFFAAVDAIGVGRIAPLLAYVRGRREDCFYVGCAIEHGQLECEPIWVAELLLSTFTAAGSARVAAAELRRRGLGGGRVGIEPDFLAAAALEALGEELGAAELVNGADLLEELRAVKTAAELRVLRAATLAVEEAMAEVVAASAPGRTEAEIAALLGAAETCRGLHFDYALLASGGSINRFPSDRPWEEGEPLSLDSGGSLAGYVGDIARMAVHGEPSAALAERLTAVEAAQAAILERVRGGAMAADLFAAGHVALGPIEPGCEAELVVHGVGLVSHEAPRLTAAGPVPYPARHAERPLRPGMVLSVETALFDRRLGFVKREDTLAVEVDGCEVYTRQPSGWLAGDLERRADVVRR